MSDNLVCSHCGAKGNIKRYKRATPLCWSHYLQMRRHGRILERTKYTPNEIIVDIHHAEIILYSGENTPAHVCLIDVQDVEQVSEHKWHLAQRRSKQYAETINNGKAIFLHTFLLGRRQGYEIDHINANGLDNRRENIRFVTQHQNVLNARTNPKSGRMGVSWRESRKRWVAKIIINGVTRQKLFKTFAEAVTCRQAWESAFVGATVEQITKT